MRAGSCAAHAVLSIETPGVTIRCLTCDAESQPAPNRLICGLCGGYRTRIVAGDELRLRRVELEPCRRRPDEVRGKTTMCNTCGCNVTPGNAHLALERGGSASAVEVLQDLLAANDRTATHNRAHFDVHGVLAINLMSSPGAGKTALLEATIAALRDLYRIAVIEGDLETDNDAARIRAQGVPAIQITTGTACHLDAELVHRALHELPLPGSTCCSSRMSGIWSVRRALISDST